MTNTYNNVYIKETSTIGGLYENDGPLGKYLDKTYNKDLYFGEKRYGSYFSRRVPGRKSAYTGAVR